MNASTQIATNDQEVTNMHIATNEELNVNVDNDDDDYDYEGNGMPSFEASYEIAKIYLFGGVFKDYAIDGIYRNEFAPSWNEFKSLHALDEDGKILLCFVLFNDGANDIAMFLGSFSDAIEVRNDDKNLSIGSVCIDQESYESCANDHNAYMASKLLDDE